MMPLLLYLIEHNFEVMKAVPKANQIAIANNLNIERASYCAQVFKPVLRI